MGLVMREGDVRGRKGEGGRVQKKITGEETGKGSN